MSNATNILDTGTPKFMLHGMMHSAAVLGAFVFALHKYSNIRVSPIPFILIGPTLCALSESIYATLNANPDHRGVQTLVKKRNFASEDDKKTFFLEGSRSLATMLTLLFFGLFPMMFKRPLASEVLIFGAVAYSGGANAVARQKKP